MIEARGAIGGVGSTGVGSACLRIVEAIERRGIAVEPCFIPRADVCALADESRRRDAAGGFADGRVGRIARARQSNQRGDRILWLDESTPTPAEEALWRSLSALRAHVNRALFLGLFSVEAHYSVYPPGAFYARHSDRFRDDDRRVLSCVLYLNDDWQAADGGVLRVYDAEHGDQAEDISPTGGTLVSFLSQRFEHEVLPTMRERRAIACWFLRR